MLKATKEHTFLPNTLKRNFKQNIPGKLLLTDIIYLFYGQGKKAYLSTIKDGSTNEILAYNVSDSLSMELKEDDPPFNLGIIFSILRRSFFKLSLTRGTH